jgi:hypothetical protein
MLLETSNRIDRCRVDWETAQWDQRSRRVFCGSGQTRHSVQSNTRRIGNGQIETRGSSLRQTISATKSFSIRMINDLVI